MRCNILKVETHFFLNWQNVVVLFPSADIGCYYGYKIYLLCCLPLQAFGMFLQLLYLLKDAIERYCLTEKNEKFKNLHVNNFF